MRICGYVYMCICCYVAMWLCGYVAMCMYVAMCICVYVYMCICVYVHIWPCVAMCGHVQMCICVCVAECIRVYLSVRAFIGARGARGTDLRVASCHLFCRRLGCHSRADAVDFAVASAVASLAALTLPLSPRVSRGRQISRLSPLVLPHTYTRSRSPARSLVHCKNIQSLGPAALTRPHTHILSLFLSHAPTHSQAAHTHSLLLAQSPSLSAQSQKCRVSRKCTGALKALRVSSNVTAVTAQVHTHLSAGAAGRWGPGFRGLHQQLLRPPLPRKYIMIGPPCVQHVWQRDIPKPGARDPRKSPFGGRRQLKIRSWCCALDA